METYSSTINFEAKNFFKSEDDIPEQFKVKEIHQREYLCNGEMKSWNGPVREVYSPVYIPTSDGLKRKLLGTYPLTTEKEAEEALNAALNAYNNGLGEWPTMGIEGRIGCMHRFVYLMLEQRDLITKLLMWEIGKSYNDSIKEFDRTIEYINATVEALKDLDRDSSRFQVAEGIIGQARRSPLGVVLSMGPFNYPLNEVFTTLIPALIMGNTILFKLPKHGILLHYPLLQAFQKAFPKGTVNSIYGRGAQVTPGILQSGKIDVLAFIGSSKVANNLKKMHPKSNRLRSVLSLEAKNAAIVTKSSDLKIAIDECLLGALSFNGQRCTALKIIFVHTDIVDLFITKLSKAIHNLNFGLPWETDVQITPLPEPTKPAYLKECIEDAIEHGAKIMNKNGGKIMESFVFPAVVYPVNSKMKLYHEEQFGPVIPIVPFQTIEEPIQYQIDSPYGMQVSIFSNDSQEISHLIDSLVNLVSRVNINCQSQRGPDFFPFTGRKDSAEGTLSVTDALRSFSIRALVATKATNANKQLVNKIVHDHDSNFLSTNYIL